MAKMMKKTLERAKEHRMKERRGVSVEALDEKPKAMRRTDEKKGKKR